MYISAWFQFNAFVAHVARQQIENLKEFYRGQIMSYVSASLLQLDR